MNNKSFKKLLSPLLTVSMVLLSFSSVFAATPTAIVIPAPVNLGTASNYAILGKSGISTVPNSAIIGNIGVSP